MKWTLTLLVSIFLAPVLADDAVPESSAAQFNRLVEQLRTNPNDNTLREKVVEGARQLNPAPEIPEDARRSVARGIAAIETAKNPADLKLALPELSNAVRAAPWWSIPYFNLALLQEKMGDFNEAIANYRLYLAADPAAKDAADVRTLIYKLEFMAEQKSRPQETLVSFSGDAAGVGIAHGDEGADRYKLRDWIQSGVLRLLQSRFSNVRILLPNDDNAALNVAIDVRNTIWRHTCGVFSCDVSVTSELRVTISSSSGSRVDRSYAIGGTHNVSKGMYAFNSGPTNTVDKLLPEWIGQEVLNDIRHLMNEDEVRNIARTSVVSTSVQ
jgi:hypothetical protein